MKRFISLLLAAMITIMQFTVVFGQTDESILKNVVQYSWDFSSAEQTANVSGTKNIPILSGGAEYEADTEKVKLTCTDAPSIEVGLKPLLTAESEENVVNIEFDMNFGKIDSQYFR